MTLREIVNHFVKTSARTPVSRSSANRARPQLEVLETRMAPSDITGGLAPTSQPTTTTIPSQTGS